MERWHSPFLASQRSHLAFPFRSSRPGRTAHIHVTPVNLLQACPSTPSHKPTRVIVAVCCLLVQTVQVQHLIVCEARNRLDASCSCLKVLLQDICNRCDAYQTEDGMMYRASTCRPMMALDVRLLKG